MTKDEAVKLFENNWWESRTYKQRAEFQLFEDRLCMPFDVFHEAIEKSLGRAVYTHEFGLNREGLQKEFLGDKPKPMLTDIINLIPKDKQVIIVLK